MARGRHQHGGDQPPYEPGPGQWQPPPRPLPQPSQAGRPWPEPSVEQAAPWSPGPGSEYLPPPWLRPPSRPWDGVWLALGVVAAIAGSVAILPLFIIAMSDNHAELYDEGPEQLIEAPEVVAAVRAACGELRDDLALLPSLGPETPRSRVRDRIEAENAAIEDFVATVRRVGDEALAADPPAVSYLRDWEALADARERYAADVAAGRDAWLAVPNDESGVEIDDRMGDAVPWCPVPDRLLRPPAFERSGLVSR